MCVLNLVDDKSVRVFEDDYPIMLMKYRKNILKSSKNYISKFSVKITVAYTIALKSPRLVFFKKSKEDLDEQWEP